MIFRIKSALLLVALIFAREAKGQQLQKVTVSYPNGGSSWPLFLAKEGGYYHKYGLDATLVFGAHPVGVAMLVSGEAQLVSYALEQLMGAASKDGSLVLICTTLNRGTFAMMAARDIHSILDLKGKRIAVGQVGDANFGYSTSLLLKAGVSPREVTWVPFGSDVAGRAAALIGGRVDAALLTAPAYFKVEDAGLRILANFADHAEIFASMALVMSKRTIAADRRMPKRFIQAHAEAIKRFYEDKPFAVKVYMQYDKTAQKADVERLYDLYAQPNAFERIPYVLTAAIQSTIDQQGDPQLATQMKAYDFHKVVDNSSITELIKDGFFEEVFGTGIKIEESRQANLAFGH